MFLPAYALTHTVKTIWLGERETLPPVVNTDKLFPFFTDIRFPPEGIKLVVRAEL
jgi:hypothetical protein